MEKRQLLDQNEIISFFNEKSKIWDDIAVFDEEKTDRIFDEAGIKTGIKVLDVACGTGILVNSYLKRNVSLVTGIDISDGMIKTAERKFGQYKNVNFICADAQTVKLDTQYDCIMVFNAFPHFSNPDMLFRNLKTALKKGGIFTVAHDNGKKAIDNMHGSLIGKISTGLMDENELEALFIKTGFHDVKIISGEEIYLVSGKKE